MKTIRVALVDDHQIVLDGLMSLLKGVSTFKISFATTQPELVTELLAQNPTDVLLTDVQMPGMAGNELAKEVRKLFPGIRILALSMSGLGHIVAEMIQDADISGYVLKDIGKQELMTAIEKIAGGGSYFSDTVISELDQHSNKKQAAEQAHLSARELEILNLIEKECSNKEIADKLFISERTVETHRKNILRKTGTNNKLGLIKWAYEHRLLNKD
ncbi:MAG: response regulator transcription factor [Bacteroidetes bacterium]|nr:response regulator transcription factor [Bacteroidota bacterium]